MNHRLGSEETDIDVLSERALPCRMQRCTAPGCEAYQVIKSQKYGKGRKKKRRFFHLRGGNECPWSLRQATLEKKEDSIQSKDLGKSVLVVGDGDFSFSVAKSSQLRSPNQLVATSFDPRSVVLAKYKTAPRALRSLQSNGVTVLHGVDATRLLPSRFDGRCFDVVIFNFPCTSIHYAENAQASVASNQELLEGFFSSVRAVLREDGEVRVTLRQCVPYSLWDVQDIARSKSLEDVGCVPFFSRDYPGYSWVSTEQICKQLKKKRKRQSESGVTVTYCFRTATATTSDTTTTTTTTTPPTTISTTSATPTITTTITTNTTTATTAATTTTTTTANKKRKSMYT